MSPTDEPDEAQRRRDRILDAAQRLFARRGVAATPIKAIAAEAGVATGLLYYHFLSKDDLVETLVTERAPSPQVEEVIAASDGQELRPTLERIAHAFLDVLEERRDVARILLQDAIAGYDTGGRLQRLLQAELDGLTAYLRTVTRATQQRAELASRILVTNLFVGTIVLPHTDRDQVVHGTVDVVLSALA